MLKAVEVNTTYGSSETYGPFDEVKAREFLDDIRQKLGRMHKSSYIIDILLPDTFSCPDPD